MPFTKNKLYVSLGTLMASGSAFAQTAYVISGVPASPLNLSSYSQVDTQYQMQPQFTLCPLMQGKLGMAQPTLVFTITSVKRLIPVVLQ